ncbi:MAG TPA: hypothetical protein VKE22_11475 [Haliangiales bacterium]|nr:hypothetical protein [Haliangiales bacterium]
MLLVAGAASAHYVPGDRVIVVQAEKDGAAVLVTYRPLERVRDAMVTAALAAKPAERAERLKALYAARALATLRLTLDGRALPADRVEAKLVDDPPGSRRWVAAVLVSVKVPAGEHVLDVDVAESEEPVVTEWLDRSEGRAAAAPAGPGVWLRGKTRLELRYQK